MKKELTIADLSADKCSKKMSERYNVVDTASIVNRLLELKTSEGNPVFTVSKIFKRGSTRFGLGMHTIVLRMVESIRFGGDLVNPELKLTNSHNGACKLSAELGVFRLICSNGLTIKSHDLGTIKIRHDNPEAQIAEEIIFGFIERIGELKQIEEKFSVKMTDEQQIDFAMKAAKTRWNKEFTEEDVAKLLEVKRPGDDGDSLWLVYNRVQEQVINGGFKISGAKQPVREIKSGYNSAKINSRLFDLAMEFAGN